MTGQSLKMNVVMNTNFLQYSVHSHFIHNNALLLYNLVNSLGYILNTWDCRSNSKNNLLQTTILFFHGKLDKFLSETGSVLIVFEKTSF